jgi:DNA-binding NarL/FixJ family response regulator
MTDLHNKDTKILITDDHLIIQEGLGFLIRGFLPKAIILTANSLESTLSVLKKESVDLLILDINIPGGNNFQMIRQVKEVQKDIKILLFSAYREETYGLRYLKTGINGYLEKNASEYEIRDAVFDTLIKGRYLSPRIQDQLIGGYDCVSSGNNTLSLLTNRELEIARLLIEGESTSRIGHQLDLKLSTVSTHKNRIFEKLNVTNVAELITGFCFELD